MPPTSNQPPRGAQGRRLLGPAALRSCPSASLHGQVRARLGPGGYCRRSGNGGPQTCLPAAHGVAPQAGPYGPSSPTSTQHPREGQASRGGRHKTSSGAASPGWLARGGEIKARQTSRGSRDVSRDDRRQAGASAHSVLVSSLVLKRQAQARSTEASSKGFHISATRPRPAGWQDGGHRGVQDGVTTRAFGRRRLLL